jgi:hypothetical protein
MISANNRSMAPGCDGARILPDPTVQRRSMSKGQKSLRMPRWVAWTCAACPNCAPPAKTVGAKLGLDRDYFNQTDPVSESIATEVRFFKRAGQAAKAQLRRLKHAPQPKYETRLAAELSAQKYAASCRQGDRSPDLDRSLE